MGKGARAGGVEYGWNKERILGVRRVGKVGRGAFEVWRRRDERRGRDEQRGRDERRRGDERRGVERRVSTSVEVWRGECRRVARCGEASGGEGRGVEGR